MLLKKKKKKQVEEGKKQKEHSISNIFFSLCFVLEVGESVIHMYVMSWFVTDKRKHTSFPFGENVNKSHLDIIAPSKRNQAGKIMGFSDNFTLASVCQKYSETQKHMPHELNKSGPAMWTSLLNNNKKSEAN